MFDTSEILPISERHICAGIYFNGIFLMTMYGHFIMAGCIRVVSYVLEYPDT